LNLTAVNGSPFNPPPHTVVIGMVLIVLVSMMLLFVGCASTDNPPAQQPAGTATTTGTPTTVSTLDPECRQVADDAQALVAEVGRLATRDATVDDVRAAASTLATSFDEARAAVSPAAQANLDQAGQALQRLQDALSAQPVNTAELRQAANDLVTALGDAATVCSGSSPTGPPTS
jgi:hypothetical protein